MNENTEKSPRGSAAAVAGWSITSLLAGAVAGNRLDEAVRQMVDLVTGKITLTWAEPTQALAINSLLAAAGSLIAFYVAMKHAIPQFRSFLSTSARMTREYDPDARPFRAVVLTLSRLDPNALAQAEKLANWVDEVVAKGTSASTILEHLCDKDPAKSGWANALSWQQTLRTIRFHAQDLRVLYFVLSPEAAAQFNLFLRIAIPLLPKRVIVRPAPHAVSNDTNVVDLTDYNKVSGRIIAACEEAKKLARCGDGDLCVDITAGQKVWSAASTIATLNSEAAFGYVNTRFDGEEGQMVIFNARISG